MVAKHIVAIGGSAGSLQPLTTFFDNTPLDGACYVVIQHIPADAQSELRSILQKHSDLDIVVASDGIKLIANVVYLAPASKQLFIEQKVLRVEPRAIAAGKTIDRFLETLATADFAGNAIVVLLSCSNEDGVRGATDVKANGGLIIAQEPVSCEFPRLSISVVARSLATLILKPADMPQAIQAYIDNIETTAA